MAGNRSPRTREQETLKAISGIAAPPAMEARPTEPQCKCRRDALLAGDSDGACADAQGGNVALLARPRRATPSTGKKQEARTLLVGMTKQAAMGVGLVWRLDVVHTATLERAISLCLINPGNYT